MIKMCQEVQFFAYRKHACKGASLKHKEKDTIEIVLEKKAKI